jgi:homoserine dehydrogenase
MSGRAWKVGVAGLGVVGGGLLKWLTERPDFAPGGDTVRLAGVTARDRTKARGVDLSGVRWFDDPVALASSPDIDIFVELVGGAEGAARDAVTAALTLGKPVVTANKALIAAHGLELARLAERTGAALYFEAAVMGGTPAVKLVREALVGDDMTAIAGILNGTCNFILTEMERTERPFAVVLAEAQRLGYAEADPTTDVGGFDAAHKAVILAALAFGGAPNLEAAEIVGIDGVELVDIRLARDLGYRIKLIAEARGDTRGATVRVAPALVPLAHPLAQAGGALNALFIEGARVGRLYLQGAGAGAEPTAAAVAADIADVIAKARRPVFGRPAEGLSPLAAAERSRQLDKAYVRVMVRDEPGAIAAISEALAKAGVSIDSFLQRSVEDSGHVPIVLITHPATEAAIGDAIEHIGAIAAVIERPRMIRVARI